MNNLYTADEFCSISDDNTDIQSAVNSARNSLSKFKTAVMLQDRSHNSFTAVFLVRADSKIVPCGMEVTEFSDKAIRGGLILNERYRSVGQLVEIDA